MLEWKEIKFKGLGLLLCDLKYVFDYFVFFFVCEIGFRLMKY